jgi:ribosome-associated heat shock protein Hsp15
VTKASTHVKPGDVLTVTVGPRVRILKVVAAGERRGPAREAQALFEDLTPPAEPRPSVDPAPSGGERTPGAGRPTKRDRRLTDRLKGEGN